MELLEKLKALKKDLRELYGIEEIAVFGSVARGEDTPEYQLIESYVETNKHLNFIVKELVLRYKSYYKEANKYLERLEKAFKNYRILDIYL